MCMCIHSMSMYNQVWQQSRYLSHANIDPFFSPMDFLVAPRHRWIYVAIFSIMALSAFEVFQNLSQVNSIDNLYLNLFLKLCKWLITFNCVCILYKYIYMHNLWIPLSLSPSPAFPPGLPLPPPLSRSLFCPPSPSFSLPPSLPSLSTLPLSLHLLCLPFYQWSCRWLLSYSYHCCISHCLLVLMLLSHWLVVSWDSPTLSSGKFHQHRFFCPSFCYMLTHCKLM